MKNPLSRRLRAYAFDPSFDTRSDTTGINQITLKVPWEENLKPGPVGEYIEVVDYDPASGSFYAPIDLDQPKLLATDGLAPSVGNAQFHQQMVYAISMTVIESFERALGRKILWSVPTHEAAGDDRYKYLPRLRIYPHALREANAYYSPSKKALLFGYFNATSSSPSRVLPGGTIFTCLSHDVIIHEMTHALLDSIHRRYVEPSNIDVLAFHEAFADIVALFQHFSYPQVLRSQIERTRGELGQQNLLGQLAQQFGEAIGRRGALRDALGDTDPDTGEWSPRRPNPLAIRQTVEPHARGSILVAAIFNAFLDIYTHRIADLLRIASGGSGILSAGSIHPDLVDRLCSEAAKTASQMLRICIRALDYCPPVDITFGDYFRALITADRDLVQDDDMRYRSALIDSFRQNGIFPRNVTSLSEESLLWQPPSSEDQDALAKIFTDRDSMQLLSPDWGVVVDRESMFNQDQYNQALLHRLFYKGGRTGAARAVGLNSRRDAPHGIFRGDDGRPTLEVHSVRQVQRSGPKGNTLIDLVVVVTGRRRGYYDQALQEKVDAGTVDDPPNPDFIFRGGATLIVSMPTGEVRYAITKNLESERRFAAQRQFLMTPMIPSLRTTYFGDARQTYYATLERGQQVEPFAMLHRILGREEIL